MNTEFMININDFKATIYMQSGFFDHEGFSYPLHKHPLIEMHIILSGSAVLRCDNEDITLQEAQALFLGQGVMHKYQSFEKGTKRLTFFIKCEQSLKKNKRITIPQPILSVLCKEIESYVLTGNDNKLKPLLSYICSDFFVTESTKSLSPMASRELIIDDFFSKNYTLNVTLDDIANELKLSKKQCEREIKRITGTTFTAELTQRRINAAIILSQTTDLPLTKISELVGYSSYSGFYKAYQRKIK